MCPRECIRVYVYVYLCVCPHQERKAWIDLGAPYNLPKISISAGLYEISGSQDMPKISGCAYPEIQKYCKDPRICLF